MLDVVVLKNFLRPYKNYEVAEKMGMTPSRLSQKINGQRSFTVEEALQLQEVLGLSLEDMKGVWKR